MCCCGRKEESCWASCGSALFPWCLRPDDAWRKSDQRYKISTHFSLFIYFFVLVSLGWHVVHNTYSWACKLSYMCPIKCIRYPPRKTRTLSCVVLQLCFQVGDEESREQLIKTHYMARVGELTTQLQISDSKAVHFHSEVKHSPECSVSQQGHKAFQPLCVWSSKRESRFLPLHYYCICLGFRTEGWSWTRV